MNTELHPKAIRLALMGCSLLKQTSGLMGDALDRYIVVPDSRANICVLVSPKVVARMAIRLVGFTKEADWSEVPLHSWDWFVSEHFQYLGAEF